MRRPKERIPATLFPLAVSIAICFPHGSRAATLYVLAALAGLRAARRRRRDAAA